MLENFSDEEIKDELLEAGYLYLDLPDGKRKRIGVTARTGIAPQINRYALQKGEEYARTYASMTELLEHGSITYDDIRASWKYHGVLLGAATFCEKLVHDTGCSCSLCVPVGFIDWCRRVVAGEDHVIIDTETTGKYGEVIDFAILSSKGHQLYNKLLRPKGAMGAEDIHHITASMVANAPTILDEWYEICAIVGKRTVITYNTKFDSERITYSLRKHGMHLCPECQWTYECAMLKYADFWDEPNRKGYDNAQWQSLENACYQQGIMLPPGLHRAMPDCQATLALLCKVAATGENSPTYKKESNG